MNSSYLPIEVPLLKVMATCPRFCPSTVCYLWLCKSIGFGACRSTQNSHHYQRDPFVKTWGSPLVEPGFGAGSNFFMIEWMNMSEIQVRTPTGWWQLIFFLCSSRILGGNDPILTHIFQMGWFNHQLAKVEGQLESLPIWTRANAPKGELSLTKDPEKRSCNGSCFLCSDLHGILHQITQHSV